MEPHVNITITNPAPNKREVRKMKVLSLTDSKLNDTNIHTLSETDILQVSGGDGEAWGALIGLALIAGAVGTGGALAGAIGIGCVLVSYY
jgi:uncharacterized membrane protein